MGRDIVGRQQYQGLKDVVECHGEQILTYSLGL